MKQKISQNSYQKLNKFSYEPNRERHLEFNITGDKKVKRQSIDCIKFSDAINKNSMDFNFMASDCFQTQFFKAQATKDSDGEDPKIKDREYKESVWSHYSKSHQNYEEIKQKYGFGESSAGLF